MIKELYHKTLCFVLVTLSAGICHAFPDKLNEYRNTYEESLTKIDAQYTKALLDLQKKHIQNMQALQDTMQKKGLLDATLAVKREIERFTDEPVIDTTRPSSIPELKILQDDYLKKTAGIPLSKSQQIIELAGKYDAALESYQVTLTKNGQLEDAITVKKEREEATRRREIASARFIVAEAGPSEPAEAPKKNNLLEIDPEPEPIQTPQTRTTTKKWTGSTDNYIKRRFDKLGDCVKEMDLASAKEYVDPGILATSNDHIINSQLRAKFDIFRMEDTKKVKLGVEKITLNEDETSATLIPKVYFNNRWHTLNAQEWVLIEGDWYISLAGGMKQQDDSKKDRKERWRPASWKR